MQTLLSFARNQCLSEDAKFVDLFCGVGGASTGAGAAGLRVDLAVDCDPDLLALEALDNPSKKAAASHQSVKNLRGQKKTARRKSKAYAKLRGKKRR